MATDFLWSGAWSARTRVPTRPPEPILQQEEGQRVHCQGTFNQRPSVPFYHLFKVFGVLLHTKMWGALVTVAWCWCVLGVGVPCSWRRSMLSTLLCTSIFTADAAKQRLEPWCLTYQIRAPHLPNFEKCPLPAKSPCETAKAQTF